MEKRIRNLKKEFSKRFGEKRKIRIFQAPGRVNLIGEHTDYNGGFVLPVAIDRSIFVAAVPNEEKILRLHSLNFGNTVVCELDRIQYDSGDGWANYPKGVAKTLQDNGYNLKGMDLLFEGNIPIGSGLSSSAAIEVASCLALTTLSGIKLDKKEMALLCQKAENEFVGMKCGIMDQFVITFAKKGTALFLDCRRLGFEYVPIRDSSINIIVTDTKVRRELSSSEYNIRRTQCEEGVKILKQYLKSVKQLRDVKPDEFERYKNKLPGIIQRRCGHVIYENERVLSAKEFLKSGLINDLGSLMKESHKSLRDLYEVSCTELDTIVDTALKVKGVIGSRMTGGGFGGCTVSLVKKENIDDFIEKVSKEYREKFQIEPEFYVCIPENGAEEFGGEPKKLF